MAWSVLFDREWREEDGIVFSCFPYNIPVPSYPPYPGFQVLETWLKYNYPNTTYQVNYNDGNPRMEIKFQDDKDAMLFKLRWQ